MLMHKGIGLERFNSLSRTRAVHALYECCCAVTWAEKIADARPYPDLATLLAASDVELSALSSADLDRILDSLAHDESGERSPELAARITRDRIGRMIEPPSGYPDR
ncbi:2-oxo-4-hydroxy-4-carboxy-5-ureidoimidazoline decarboxylase [Nocardia transvalensis]|uniref:2-oxo-4-hydroxy-4-carboxy-5-ureidoimidazoline decarboxylase n=1 Tax=Nocardia transvalensis TaxID=37333 RepID=A0A7W9PCZ6_9NOCA|nr:2-oxo-4-hydroxy-4-carboxy-5-ureidoimidazoline decarboxylase [Nocardia transvalensis]MBB5913373.1 2-oxo-4-hydroxy-4-carboxy-5-ureidoimidazoline decarboxylase [Nocardia transvalensis]